MWVSMYRKHIMDDFIVVNYVGVYLMMNWVDIYILVN